MNLTKTLVICMTRNLNRVPKKKKPPKRSRCLYMLQDLFEECCREFGSCRMGTVLLGEWLLIS